LFVDGPLRFEVESAPRAHEGGSYRGNRIADADNLRGVSASCETGEREYNKDAGRLVPPS